MKIYYFAELILPSKNAYSIHVMKMCNALGLKNKFVKLLIFKNNKNTSLYKIYNCKKNFYIKDFNLNGINFFNRIIFCFQLLKLFNKNERKKNDKIIISRSILPGLLFGFFKYKVIIEIHHELSGLTKNIFNFAKPLNFFKKIKFIFISKNLRNKFNLNNKNIVLDDAVDLNNHVVKKKIKILRNTCVYTGSLAKGKGLEKIIKISTILKNIKFHIYGDFENSNYDEEYLKKYKNIKYHGYIEYRKIPEILKKYQLLLMPYSKKVYVRAKNIEAGKYMSPMKLFDYMASNRLILASRINVYLHILNERNSILIKSQSPEYWAKKIIYVLKNYRKLRFLKKNAYKKVKNFTWEKRADKILNFLNE